MSLLADPELDEEDRARESARWLRPELIAPWWEILLVLAVMLGPFAYSSARFAVRSQSSEFLTHLLNTHNLLRQTAVEAGLLAAFLFYLRWRGWTPADLKIRIGWQGTLLAPFLAIAAGLANAVTATVFTVGVISLTPHPSGTLALLAAHTPHIPHHSVDVSWAPIFLVSIVNAYLEELVFMGYAFNQFAARRSPLFALLVMVFLRMLLHTYKGPAGMLGIAAFSLVFGLAYVYFRRLWPLIFSHTLTDAIAFSLFKLIFGK